MLKTTINGTDATRAPLLIVHGLFGSARNWGVIAKRLSDNRKVISVDMRNHADSFWADDHSYGAMAADLAEVIEANGGQADVIGHSMGGKASMVLALKWPELVRRLIVADIAPVAYGHSQSHLIAAMRAVDLGQVSKRSDADKLLAQSIEDPGVRAFLLQSLDVANKRWRLNFDVLEAQMNDITGWPDIQGEFAGPVLFLSGAQSDYVKTEHRPVIKALFPNARFAKIPNAGHWLHAERAREFEATARVFLD